VTYIQILQREVSDAEAAYLSLSRRIDTAIAWAIDTIREHTDPVVSADDLIALLRDIRGN
jgi:hypothetical protein